MTETEKEFLIHNLKLDITTVEQLKGFINDKEKEAKKLEERAAKIRQRAQLAQTAIKAINLPATRAMRRKLAG